MTFYICARKKLCKKPCNSDCFYTRNFKQTKLYFADVKPEQVTLIEDVNGNYWQFDPDFAHNLPELMRKKPEHYLNVPYEYIAQIEIRRLLLRNSLK